MGFGLTKTLVAEFAAKPFIQKAMMNPMKPTSVLSFFLGVDYESASVESLRSGNYIFGMLPFWFDGHEDFDELCQTFTPVIRTLASENFNHECTAIDGNTDYKYNADEWNSSIDGKVAQIVLFDQLSRNCFRGTDEAFTYDDYALSISRKLIDVALEEDNEKEESEQLEGELYTPYATFLVLCSMHSEVLKDHERGLQIIDWAQNHPHNELKEWWGNQREFLLGHKAVIDEFGRYPHRNSKKGRESTEEELKWLSSDDIPIWAKSQG